MEPWMMADDVPRMQKLAADDALMVAFYVLVLIVALSISLGKRGHV